jgi:predicted GNAT family acetyltransferase
MNEELKNTIKKYENDLITFRYSVDKNNFYIQNIIVKNQGKGIGTKLMKEVIKVVKSHNKVITLHACPQKARTKKQNKKNQLRLNNFYKSLGMKQGNQNFFYI